MNTAEIKQQNCHAWIEIFTGLARNGVPSSERLERITSPEVRFIDPFNDLTGRDALQALLEHTRKELKNIRFEVADTAVSGNCVYVKWYMTARLKLLGEWRVEGMSEVEFDEEGRVRRHQDYWDAARQFYEHLPVMGWLLRRIRSLLSPS